MAQWPDRADHDAEDLLITLLVRGGTPPARLQEILDIDGEPLRQLAEKGLERGLVQASDVLSLTAAGTEIARRHARGTPKEASALLALYEAEFLHLNARVKRICADWQLGGQVTRTSRVIGALRQANNEAQSMLRHMALSYRRAGAYGRRLDTALARVRCGEHDFVAHPAVDSFHSVWFELHQELLHTLDRDRATERETG